MKQYTKEEIENLKKELNDWNKDSNRKYTRGILEKAVGLTFKDYKDPTETMSIEEKMAFDILMKEQLEKNERNNKNLD